MDARDCSGSFGADCQEQDQAKAAEGNERGGDGRGGGEGLKLRRTGLMASADDEGFLNQRDGLWSDDLL